MESVSLKAASFSVPTVDWQSDSVDAGSTLEVALDNQPEKKAEFRREVPPARRPSSDESEAPSETSAEPDELPKARLRGGFLKRQRKILARAAKINQSSGEQGLESQDAQGLAGAGSQ